MEFKHRSGKPSKSCQNCDLPCSGLFCCEWCFHAYLDRRDVKPPGQMGNGSTPSRESQPNPQRRMQGG